MLERGEIKSVDALWVTHYHFDHTDGIPLFQKEFDVPCITDRRLAEVITDPRAWRLPCLASETSRVDRPMEDGQSWEWREFKLTSYFFPGQTLYHAALLVEGDGLRMFFVGDSHTMSGLDDYCAQNRNFLGRGVGFQYCLSLIEKLQPTHIFNCHVDPAFTFTAEEIRFMRETLDEREKRFGALVPWEHANYATDESWVRCFPYTQQAKAGQRLTVDVVVTNHAAMPQATACRAVLPKAWGGNATDWSSAEVPAKAEKPLPLAIQVPAGVPAGRYVLPIDVKHGPLGPAAVCRSDCGRRLTRRRTQFGVRRLVVAFFLCYSHEAARATGHPTKKESGDKALHSKDPRPQVPCRPVDNPSYCDGM